MNNRKKVSRKYAVSITHTNYKIHYLFDVRKYLVFFSIRRIIIDHEIMNHES